MGVLALIHTGVESSLDQLRPFLPEAPRPDGSAWSVIRHYLSRASEYALGFALWAAGIFFYLKISKYIVLALISPVLALLSERTEELLTGAGYSFSLKNWIRDSLRGGVLALRNLLLELALGAALLLLQLLLALFAPILAVFILPLLPVASFVVGAYFYGFSMLDYRNERRQMSIRESTVEIRKRKGLATGIGSIFILLQFIPVIGISAACITCTVAAVLAAEGEDHLTG